VLGDFEMKIKDIVIEGFTSTFLKGLVTPKAAKNITDLPTRGTGAISDVDIEKQANKMFAPGGEQDWETPEQTAARTDQEAIAKKKKMQAAIGAATTATGKANQQSSRTSRQVRTTGQDIGMINMGSNQYVRDNAGNWVDSNGTAITNPAVSMALDKEANRQAQLIRQTAQMAPGYQPMTSGLAGFKKKKGRKSA